MKSAVTKSLRQFSRLLLLDLAITSSLSGSFLLAQSPSDQSTVQVTDAVDDTAIAGSEDYVDLLGRIEALETELAATKETADEASKQSESLLEKWSEKGDPEVDIVKSQTKEPEKKKDKAWYEKLGVRGYAQFRLNEITDDGDGSVPAQLVGDRSAGDNQSFLIRRARLIIFGDVSDHLYVYLQPDFAVTTPGSTDNTLFAQIRDWYGDVYLTENKVHRLRVGNSKVPYGWENMQSSSNRLALDRSDSWNSAVRNERDLGVFYYWTPESAQDYFKSVVDDGLKGSGNYGVFAFGCYNGQGGSLLEQNDNLHVVTRLTLPFKFDNGQLWETSIQGYTGEYVVLGSAIRPLGVGTAVRPIGTLETGDTTGFRDERIGWTSVWYPQPFGIQTEWNVGRSPQLNAAQTAIEEGDIRGGYVQFMFKHDTACHGILIPFYRYNMFEGGYKSERNAPNVNIREHEVGCEWQFNKQTELTMMYTWTDRTNTQALADRRSYDQFVGQFLRCQFQINY
jgi:hypothetical protein